MPWAGTDLDTLDGVFVESIRGVVPRHQRQQEESWKPLSGNREVPPGIGTRWFRLEWDTVGYANLGVMSGALVDTAVTLSIVVNYGSMPEAVAKRIVEDDLYQIRDVINAIKPTTDGLVWFDADDWSETADSKPDQFAAILQFNCRYMKRRA